MPTSHINHPGNEFYTSVQHRFSQQSGALNSGATGDDDDDDDGGSSSSDGLKVLNQCKIPESKTQVNRLDLKRS